MPFLVFMADVLKDQRSNVRRLVQKYLRINITNGLNPPENNRFQQRSRSTDTRATLNTSDVQKGKIKPRTVFSIMVRRKLIVNCNCNMFGTCKFPNLKFWWLYRHAWANSNLVTICCRSRQVSVTFVALYQLERLDSVRMFMTNWVGKKGLLNSGLFTDTVNCEGYVATHVMRVLLLMINWYGCRRKQSWPIWRGCFYGINLHRMRETIIVCFTDEILKGYHPKTRHKFYPWTELLGLFIFFLPATDVRN